MTDVQSARTPLRTGGPTQTVTNTWLAGGEVLAALHVPALGADTGVVICPPLGQDHIVSYRTMRHLADRLALGGLAAIRFDYPGQGDSATAFHDDSLETGTALAAAALREAGCTRIVYLGLGSGALAASAGASADTDAAGLVLWDPVPSGRQWLRRQKSLYTLSLGDDALAGPDGTVVLIGIELPQSVADHVAGLDFDPVLAERMPVLLARREGPSGSVPKALRSLGERLAVVEVPGHEEALDASSVTASIPAESVARVAGWLLDRYAGHDGAAAQDHVAQDASDRGPRPQPTPDDEILLTEDGVLLSETLLRIGPNDVFGIETRPVDVARDAPGVVLHNGSSEHRIGATRYQVVLARRLAAQGLRVLRVDRRGTGETTDVTPGESNLLFSREWIEDGEAAVDYLKLPSEKVGVVGMCVGGWVGLRARPGTVRFVGVLALNDYRLKPVEPGVYVDAYTRGDSKPETRADRLRRLPRDLANRAVAVAKARLAYPALVAIASRGYIRLAEPVLRPALSAGTDVLLYMSPEDEEIFEAHGGLKASARLKKASGRLTVARKESGDHSLFSPGIRADAVDWVVAETLREFGLSAKGSLSETGRGSADGS